MADSLLPALTLERATVLALGQGTFAGGFGGLARCFFGDPGGPSVGNLDGFFHLFGLAQHWRQAQFWGIHSTLPMWAHLPTALLELYYDYQN